MTDIQDTPSVSSNEPEPTSDKPHPAEVLLASVRAAMQPGASPETRTLGTAACRAILTTLAGRPSPGGPTPPAAQAPSLGAAVLPQLGTILPQLSTLPPAQLRELVGTVLRGVLPANRPAAGPRYRTAPTRIPEKPGDD